MRRKFTYQEHNYFKVSLLNWKREQFTDFMNFWAFIKWLVLCEGLLAIMTRWFKYGANSNKMAGVLVNKMARECCRKIRRAAIRVDEMYMSGLYNNSLW